LWDSVVNTLINLFLKMREIGHTIIWANSFVIWMHPDTQIVHVSISDVLSGTGAVIRNERQGDFVVGLSILTKFTENTQPGGHRRRESLSCHRRMIGIPSIYSFSLSLSLLRRLATLSPNSTSVLNSCFLMDSQNHHDRLQSLGSRTSACPFSLAPLIHERDWIILM